MPDGAMEKIEELENEIAILFTERETAWQQATTAQGRVNVLEHEKEVNAPKIKAYHAITAILYNTSAGNYSTAWAKMKQIADRSVDGTRQASESPGDAAMRAAALAAMD